nr:reverse transcriptase domain-containing protein [Tanacetum cinerariifolium]
MAKFPLKYLRVRVGCSMVKCSNWNAIIYKFTSRLSFWKARLSSVGGRLTLIKHVLKNLPTYYMSIYIMPVLIQKKLESLRNNFFIGGDQDDKKMTWSDPSEDPSSDHIPPLTAISLFFSSIDDTKDSDTPDTPPSPTHGTPFTEITSSTKRSPIIPRRRVMILAPGQPIHHGRLYRCHLNGLVHMMTAKKRVGPLPVQQLTTLIVRSFFSLDLPSTSTGPSCKRRRSPMSHVPALSHVSEALSLVRADLIPSPKRVRDSGYLADVEVDPKETSLRDDVIVKDRGIDARFVVETVTRDEVRVERVTHSTMPEDTPEPAQEERAIKCTKMPNTQSGASMTQEEVEELVTRRVAEEMEAREAAIVTPLFSDPSEDPSSDHIPPLTAILPFFSSVDDTKDSDTPDTPPSPTHGTPFTEITSSTKRSPVIPRRQVMILAPGQPIHHGRPYRCHLNGPVHMMTARKRVGPLPVQQLTRHHQISIRMLHLILLRDTHCQIILLSRFIEYFCGPSCKRRRSPMTHVPALSHVSEALSLVRADLIPSPKRVKDSGYLADVEVDAKETSLRDDVIIRGSDEPHLEQDNNPEVIEGVKREQGHRIVGVESAVTALTERIAESERDHRRLRGTTSVKGQRVDRLLSVGRLEACARKRMGYVISHHLEILSSAMLLCYRKMPNTQSGASMTQEEVEELVTRRVAKEMEAREAAMNLEPLNERTEGIVGLTCWFKKMETVFNISNYPSKYQVKYATCTLQDSALTWWNSYKRTISFDDAYATKWAGLMKLITEELTLLCTIMVSDEEDRMERFIRWLPNNIQRNGYAARSAENKKRIESNPRENHRQQQPFKRSFVSLTFSALLDVTPSTLDTSYAVELADGRISETNIILRGCTLGLLGHPFDIDLMPIELGSFDIIVDMDWMAKNHIMIVCDEKVVRIPYGDEVLIIQSDDIDSRSKLKLNIISCTKTQKYIEEGCQVYLAQVMSKKEEDKSKESEGVHVDPAKIVSIKDWKSPKAPTKILQFLCLAGYYRRFIEGFSKIARPMTKLT